MCKVYACRLFFRQFICARPAYGSLKVLRRISRSRCGFLLLCLLATATTLIGQTNSYTIPVGSVPNALAINPATNKIYVVNSAGDTLSVIDGGN